MQELAELSAETRDIALSRFRLLEPHLERHRSSRQAREFPFCAWLDLVRQGRRDDLDREIRDLVAEVWLS
jgi:hypothetical protein